MLKKMSDMFEQQVKETLHFNVDLIELTACDCGAGPVDCCVPPQPN